MVVRGRGTRAGLFIGEGVGEDVAFARREMQRLKVVVQVQVRQVRRLKRRMERAMKAARNAL